MNLCARFASLVLLVLTASFGASAWQVNAHSTDATGHITVSTYGPDGKLMKVTDGMGRHTFPGKPAPTFSSSAATPTRQASVTQAAGMTIHVPADQPTIQAAINAANNGDTVLVSDGTYPENINFSGKAITLTSVNGPATTIIDGGAVDSVVTFKTSEGSGSVLNGFTIQNGFSNFNKPNFGDGGGVFISSASPTITNNVIINNKGCEGVGIFSHFGSPLIQGNTISNNVQSGCSGGIGGGGIAIGGASTPQIIGNVISNNSMPAAGGANGGGISLFAAGAPVIQNNIIHGNTGTAGGGLALANDASPQIVDNLFFNNTAGQGGGIYWVIPTSSPGMVLLNNTLAANSSASGSAIFDGGFDTNMFIQNNLIIGATGQSAYFCNQLNGATTPATFANNDVFSNGAAISGNCTVSTGTNGTISSDPLFVAPALTNFRLQPGSPAIDAGNNNARIPLPTTDLDGNPRIFNATADMGAYEFQATTTSYSATALTFGATPVSTTSAPQAITISNTGSVALQIVPVSLTGDFSETDNCSGSNGIAAGQSCTINVSFTPSAGGIRTGQFTVTSNDAAGATTVTLSGTGGVPVVSLSSTSLAFGNQPVSTTSNSQSVTLTNSGNGPLTITGISASGDFSQTNNCGTQVAAGANCTITVSFTPSAVGARSGSITINDNATGTPQSVSLTGTGTGAIATLSATSLSFGKQPVGASSAAQSVTLTNNGNIALTISGIAISGTNSGDFSQSNNCGSSLAPATSCSISVVFTPSAIGSRSSSLAITDNAGGSPQTVSLSGTGAAAIAALSATSLSFGNQAVGTSSAAQSVTLTNNGNIALTISSLAISGTNNGDFSQSNNCGSSLAPAASCSINVVFMPSAIGSRSASLAITDNANGSPQSVSLSGTGTAAIAVLSATSLSFGNQPVGSSSAAQSVTLTNNGNIALTISSIAIAGVNTGDFSQANNCASSLAPAAGCTISMVFTPTASGSRSASLAITDNAGGSPQTIALAGTGTDFSLSASPSSLSIPKRSSKSSTITIAPLSGFNQTVALQCSGAPANSTCSVSPSSVTLNGTSASTAQLTVTTGKTSGTFHIVVSGSFGTLTRATTVTVTVQ